MECFESCLGNPSPPPHPHQPTYIKFQLKLFVCVIEKVLTSGTLVIIHTIIINDLMYIISRAVFIWLQKENCKPNTNQVSGLLINCVNTQECTFHLTGFWKMCHSFDIVLWFWFVEQTRFCTQQTKLVSTDCEWTVKVCKSFVTGQMKSLTKKRQVFKVKWKSLYLLLLVPDFTQWENTTMIVSCILYTSNSTHKELLLINNFTFIWSVKWLKYYGLSELRLVGCSLGSKLGTS